MEKDYEDRSYWTCITPQNFRKMPSPSQLLCDKLQEENPTNSLDEITKYIIKDLVFLAILNLITSLESYSFSFEPCP